MMALLLIFISTFALAKKVKVRKTQEVDFAEVDINGKSRNPDGALLVQKKGMRFMPMHLIKTRFNDKLSDSHHHLRSE